MIGKRLREIGIGATLLAACAFPLAAQQHERPFEASPFNRAVPEHPRLDPRSAEIIAFLFGNGRLGTFHVAARPEARDYTMPHYTASASDPSYTIHCTAYCTVEGQTVHIPPHVQPENSGGGRETSDHHLAIVDTTQEKEFDFWQADIPSGRGGTLVVSGGSATPIHSDGLHTLGTHSGFSLRLGLIQPQELLDGAMPHAVQIVVPCTTKHMIYPAFEADADTTCPPGTQGAPDYGSRIILEMSDREIDALNAPSYLKTFYRALAKYGAFVADAGSYGPPAFRLESGLSYTSIGKPNPWSTLATRNNIIADENGFYTFPLDIPNGAVAKRLRVVAPCVTKDTCL